MNRRIRAALAVLPLVLVLVLTACGHHSLSGAVASASARATSSTAQQDKQAGKQAVDTVLPAKYQTPSGLADLAFNKGDRQALAAQLRIPKANRKAFGQALATAALAAYKQGAFKKHRDPTQEAAHQRFIGVTFPSLVKQYETK